jgi:membrane protein YqaA with SNARE-associated domain
METWVQQSLAALLAVFVVALVSATLVPMGSEPAVFGLIKLQPELFWPTILVATAGNTVGGAITWWMGRGAARAKEALRRRKSQEVPDAPDKADADEPDSRSQRYAQAWLGRWGAKACLLSWLPVVGDPLCAVAGWLKLPFWPCVFYMALGKFARYLTATLILMRLI